VNVAQGCFQTVKRMMHLNDSQPLSSKSNALVDGAGEYNYVEGLTFVATHPDQLSFPQKLAQELCMCKQAHKLTFGGRDIQYPVGHPE
jgi:hypothetical protein